MLEYEGPLDKEQIYPQYIRQEDELYRKFRDEINYVAPSAGSTIGSGIGSVIGTAVAQSVARHAVATTAGAIVGTSVIAIIFGGRVVKRAFGPLMSGLVLSNIVFAGTMILTSVFRLDKEARSKAHAEHERLMREVRNPSETGML